MRKSKLYLFSLALLLSVPGCHSQGPSPKIPEISNGVCRSTYSNLYRGDRLDFRVIFGYKDSRPARYVGDRYERAYFVQKLVDYGFVRSPGSETEFSYSLVGPDGHVKKIMLHVVSSSVGPDDDENRRDPFQKWSSQHAEKFFLDGLRSADVVFYYGHSRNGGGPDFSPPRLTLDQHTDYRWYKKYRPGLKKMTATLKNTPARLKILGLYSCASDGHFTKSIQQTKPKLALFVSDKLLYYADALDGMIDALKSILQMKCRDDFHPHGTKTIHFLD